MKAWSGPAELVEKEKIILQLNAQVEEFLRRGGAIQVVTCNAKPATEEDAGSAWDDGEESTPYSDRADHVYGELLLVELRRILIQLIWIFASSADPLLQW